ncbi:MAG: hypothetical protein KDD22_07285, partial [Bdellovibrionales bacterium]|nr:hypothetical protein [Bdellovibrionales bacterium]
TRQAYLNHINEIEVMLNLLKQKNAEESEYYSLGLELLHQHFPENITRWPDTGYPYLEMDFVYPITINEEGLTKPLKDVHPQARPTLESPDSFYRVQSFDERRSDHFFYKDVNGAQTREGIKDYLFDGFPAFWIDLSGKGTGLHGPIRYSAAIDQKSWASYMASHQIPPDEDKKHVLGKLDGHHLRAKWNQPPFNYIPGLDADIETRYRFEVVRTADSGGCFRAEPMEIRHLLPAEPSKLKQVNWRVLDYHDVLPNGQYVDVNYYVTNPYQGPIHRMQWYRTHFVPYELRQAVRNSNKKIEQENLDQIVKSHLPEIHVFPYLNPNVLEFSYYRDQRKPEERRINPHPIPIIENARSTMGYFNRAGEK